MTEGNEPAAAPVLRPAGDDPNEGPPTAAMTVPGAPVTGPLPQLYPHWQLSAPTPRPTVAPLKTGGALAGAQTFSPRSPLTVSHPDPRVVSRSAPSGMLAALSRHRRLSWAGGIVAFLLASSGSLGAGIALASPNQPAAPIAAPSSAAASNPIPAPTPTPTPSPTVDAARPVPATIPAPLPVRTCSIAGAAVNAALGRFEGHVVDVATGTVLFDRNASVPAATASGMKLLTAAAALAVLGTDARMATRVVTGSTPGSIVLVGGGDPTLSAVTSGESYYPGAPKLADLAAQTLAAWKASHPVTETIREVVLDASLWSTADRWDSSWPRSEQTEGYQPEITALMVDGDRANPVMAKSPRSTDPIGRAGAAFVTALRLAAPPAVTIGIAASGAKELAIVHSQPVATLIAQLLPASDNTLAEMLARLVSKTTGADGSAASLSTVIPSALKRYGLDVSGLTIKDGSGLSGKNAVPPNFLTSLMTRVLAGEGNLGVVYSNLPVSGISGTLAGRFTGANAVAKGAVTAKTGFILTAYTLSGIIRSADGSKLAFSFMAEDAVNASAVKALDSITTAAYRCGTNLSNY